MNAHVLDLAGDWELHWAVHPDEPAGTPAELGTRDDYRSVAAVVPGNVELDLVRAGVLPDPYVGEQIRQFAPYELADWWLTREVDLPAALFGDPDDPAPQVVLRFEGLDTFATVFWDGQLVGSSDNMLIEHEFDLSAVARPGRATVAVHLRSPLLATDAHDYSPGMVAHEERMEMLRSRRAPHTYGWDIAPRLLTSGIWRPVTVVVRPLQPRIEECHLVTREISGGASTPDAAELDLWFAIERWPWGHEVELELVLSRPDGGDHHDRFPVDFRVGHQTVTVPHPVLWWPRGYGDPALHDVRLRLHVDGTCVDEQQWRLGIRTAEVRRRLGSSRTPADADVVDAATVEDFQVVVNGVEVFCSGTNWVPVDALHGRDAARMPRALQLLDEVGGNLVRCWGGNVYESEEFFDFCDTTGILVWQDFSLACGLTPQDDAFAEVMRVEARAVIRRLRRHSCLLLWCGNNENDMFWDQRGLDPAQDRISREVLPAEVTAHDPGRPYVASSPFYTTRSIVTGAPRVEEHLWGARAAFKAPFYTEHGARFVSEIGYHGSPSLTSLRRMVCPGFTAVDPADPVQRLHATEMTTRRRPRGINRIQLMLDQAALHVDFDPDVANQVVQASQITQAESFKFFVEHARADPRRTGLVWWNLLDGWPQISDAVVDHWFAPKLAFHHLRTSQRPFLVVAGEADGWHRPLTALNDTRTWFAGEVWVSDLGTGAELWRGAVTVPPGAAVELARLPIARGRDTMLLLQWEGSATPPSEVADRTATPVSGANHYLDVAGRVRLADYLGWLDAIAPLVGIPVAQLWPELDDPSHPHPAHAPEEHHDVGNDH